VPGTLSRRALLAGCAAAAAARSLPAAGARLTKARIAAITDEIGATQADAIAFAKQHALQWVELRNVPGSKQEFAFLINPELKRYAAELVENKLKVSLLKTSLLKFSWNDAAEKPRWDRRREDLIRAITAAQILGTDKIRIFTGARVPDPRTAYPAIVETMRELIPLAENARVRLLIENDATQNIGTCAELAAILNLLPSKTLGFNWDPWNALTPGEAVWPDGYAKLPRARMLNAQIKSEALLPGGPINCRAMMEAMRRDGYQGEISIATETFDGTFEKADGSVRELMHIVGELA
jgi:sugar phosphate isomerase/epimerase